MSLIHLGGIFYEKIRRDISFGGSALRTVRL